MEPSKSQGFEWAKMKAKTTAIIITAVTTVLLLGRPRNNGSKGGYIFINKYIPYCCCGCGELPTAKMISAVTKSKRRGSLKSNWLSSRINPAAKPNSLLAQAVADLDYLIAHPKAAAWPTDQKATHAAQVLEIAHEENLALPDYQLDWLHSRSQTIIPTN